MDKGRTEVLSKTKRPPCFLHHGLLNFDGKTSTSLRRDHVQWQDNGFAISSAMK